MKLGILKWLVALGLFSLGVGLQAAELEEGSLVGGLKDLKQLNQKLVRMSERCSKATVALVAKGGGGTGSGVVVSEDGLILTGGHVVEAMNGGVVVIFPDGTRRDGKVLGGEFDRDAAMVQITEEGNYPFVELAEESVLMRNQWCVALGHPGGFDPTRTPPIRLGRVVNKTEFIESDCAVVGGDSGGPLFNIEGELIGIHSNIGTSLSQNRHVPLYVFREHWDMMKEGKRQGSKFASKDKADPDRPVMGVQLGESGANGGVKVMGVMEGSPAERAGLKRGDEIMVFAGKKVRDRESLIKMTGGMEVGKPFRLMYRRDGERRRAEVKLVRMSELLTDVKKSEATPQKSSAARESSEKPDEGNDVGDPSGDALDRFLDEMLKDGSGELRLTEEQLEKFGGIQRLMERIRKRGDDGQAVPSSEEESEPEKRERDARLDEAEGDGQEAEVDLEGLLRQSMQNGGRLELTPSQLEKLGGSEKLAETIRGMVAKMSPDELKKMAELAGGIELTDPFFASVMKALKPAVSKAGASTVSVLAAGKPVALGTVVSESGWILTKNEETLEGELDVRVGDESYEAVVLQRFPRRDLALLSIDADGLSPVRWAKSANKLPLGTILTAPSEDGEAMGIGLISVKERAFTDVGFLGIRTEQVDEGIRIVEVVSKSAAEKSGLKAGDLIVELEGEPVADPIEFGNYVRSLRAGDEIEFLLLRRGEEVEAKVELGARPQGSSSDRFRRMNEMSGPLSAKSSGYPAALQHDIPLSPEQCGGPVLNLKGECIGVNVSRAGRVKTLAIPAADILSLLGSVEEDEPGEAELKAVRELIKEVQSNLSELQELLEELEIR